MRIICYLIQLYILILLASIVLSWFPSTGGFLSQVQRVLRSLTEPVLAPLRAAIPPVRMGAAALDMSPLIVLIGLQVLNGFICR